MSLPSGDQTGEESWAGPAVRGTDWPPVTATVKMCPRKLNAIGFPSGEMAGYRSQRGLVSTPRPGRGVSARAGKEETERTRTRLAIPRRRRALSIAELEEAGLSIENRTHADSPRLQMNSRK